jgi:hypothetical protein
MNPGFYQLSFRGLSWREAWRLSNGPLAFGVAVVLKLIGFRGQKMWLPAVEGEQECAEADLSAEARAVVAPLVAEALQLGYLPGVYSQVRHERCPATRDSGGCVCLHREGNRAMHLAFVVTEVMGQPVPATAITGLIVDHSGDRTYDFSPTKEQLDGDGFAIKRPVREKSVAATEVAMQEFLRQGGCVPSRFGSIAEFKRVADRIDTAMWAARAKRGLVLPVGGTGAES